MFYTFAYIIKNCSKPDDFSIKKFLLLNKAEVKGMFLTEWDQDKVLAQAVNEDRRQVNS